MFAKIQVTKTYDIIILHTFTSDMNVNSSLIDIYIYIFDSVVYLNNFHGELKEKVIAIT